MSNDLMIPNKADVPSYILKPEQARAVNDDAASGISTGFPARVKLSAGKFILVDGSGEEKAYPASKLVVGPDENQYLPTIVLRAKKSLSKSFYLGKFDPSATEFQPPDCWSNDSERPDPSVATPQSDTCAACPYNAFGSGKDQNGNATKGKACTDNKILAVFVPPFGVHSFKLPPASLKNFGIYVKQLSAAGIPLATVKTLVGFDPTVSTSVLIFRFGGYLPEESLPKLEELSKSLEVEEIIGGTTVAQAAPAATAQIATAPKETADDLGLGADAPVIDDKAEKKKQEAAAKKAAQEAEDAAKVKAEKERLAKEAEEAKQRENAAPTDIPDDDLMKELGL